MLPIVARAHLNTVARELVEIVPFGLVLPRKLCLLGCCCLAPADPSVSAKHITQRTTIQLKSILRITAKYSEPAGEQDSQKRTKRFVEITAYMFGDIPACNYLISLYDFKNVSSEILNLLCTQSYHLMIFKT